MDRNLTESKIILYLFINNRKIRLEEITVILKAQRQKFEVKSTSWQSYRD